MALTAEQLTIVRSSLDPTGYVAGAAKVAEANARIASSGDQVVQATTKTTRSLVDSGSAFDRYRKQADDLYAAQVKLQQVQTAGQRALAAGRTDQDTYNSTLSVFARRVEEARIANDRMGGSAKNVSFAMRDLGLQSIDAFQGIATGQPILRTFIQQGAQVVQVNAAMGVGFRETAAGVGRFVAGLASNPLVLFGAAAAAVVGGVVAIGAAAESTARQTLQLQTQLRATRDDYVAMAAEVRAAAKDIAATTGIGTADALAAGKTIAANPNFAGTQAQLEALIRTSADLAAVMGKTVPQAAEQMAQALQDPGAEAKRLADQHFPGMSQALAYSIKLMADGGDRAGAFAKVLGVIQTTTRDAADQGLTPLQRAMQGLSEAFTKTGQDGRSLGESIGKVITDAAASAVTAITDVVTAIEKLRQSSIVQGMTSPQQGAINTLDYWRRRQQGTMGVAVTAGAAPSVVVNQTTGAMGLMGVMPATAAQYGLNPSDLFENVQAGVRDFLAKLSVANGNIDIALKNYGGFVTKDPTNYIASVRGQNIVNLSTDAAGLIEGVAMRLGVTDPRVIAVLQQLALQESSGHHTTGVQKYGPPEAFGPPDFMGPQATFDQILAGRNLQSIQDQAFTARLGLGLNSTQLAANQVAQQLQGSDLKAAIDAGDIERVKQATEALEKLKGQESDLITEQQKLARSAVDATRELSAQTGFSRTMAAIEQQFAAAARASGQAIDQKALALAKAAEQTKLATDFSDAIEATNQATEAQLRINAAYDGSAKSLEEAQNREKAYAQALKDFDQNAPDFTQHVDDYAAALDRGSAATRAFQEHQQALQTIANSFTQAFDQISQAITNSFLSGTGAAVNWRNVMVSIAQQVLSAFIKLAVINPIINSLFSQNNSTLGSVIGALGSSGGGASTAGGGGSGVLGILNNGSSLVSGVNTLTGGWLGDTLGITGENGLLSNIGLGGGSNGLFSGVNNLFQPSGFLGSNGTVAGILNGGILGTSTSEAALLSTNAAIANSLGGAFGPATADALAANTVAPTGLFGGSSLGAVAGGIGAGFGLGSLAGGFIQSSMGKVGPAPTIGAGGGALAGAAIGSVIPVIGTAIGAIIGGLIGGAGGGLIGPKAPTPFNATVLTTNQGLLGQLNSANQLYPSNADQTAQEISQINDVLQTLGIRISDVALAADKLFQVGSDKARPDLVGSTLAGHSVADIFSAFRFTSPNDQQLAGYLSGQSFGSLQDLATAVQKFQQDEAAIAQFLTNIDTSLSTMGKTTGAVNDQIKAINDQFNTAISTAQSYASNVAATSDQVARLTQAESDLAAARDKQIQATLDAINHQTYLTDQSLQARYLTAIGITRGNALAPREAALLTFDVQAQQQRDQFKAQLIAQWGDTITTTQGFADQMAALERTLGEERLAVIKQYDDQITQATVVAEQQRLQSATSIVTSLSGYVRGLQFGGSSALSPTAQYELANRQFNAVSGAALAGDANSLSQLPSYSDALLSTARNLYGSGQGYADAFSRVIDTINRALPSTTDQLTALTFTSETRTQTQILSGDLADVKALLQSVLTAINQNTSKPVRAAA